MIKLKKLLTEYGVTKPGDVWQGDYNKNNPQLVVEPYHGKWYVIEFDLVRKKVQAHGTTPEKFFYKMKPKKVTSGQKSMMKKILQDPEMADWVNQDDSNMTKKALRVIK